MQLQQVDARELEPAQAPLNALLEPFGSRVDRPSVRSPPNEPRFRCDDDAGRIWRERFGDYFFADERSVRIGRIDEIHAAFDDVPNQFDGAGSVGRRSPNPAPRDAHRSEAKTVDGQIAADRNRPPE
jgi:hypothetical protein